MMKSKIVPVILAGMAVCAVAGALQWKEVSDLAADAASQGEIAFAAARAGFFTLGAFAFAAAAFVLRRVA